MRKTKKKIRIISYAMAVILGASCFLWSKPNITVVQASDDAVTAEGPFQIGTGTVTFDSSLEWSEVGDGVDISVLNTSEALKKGTTLSADILLDANASFSGILKLQG